MKKVASLILVLVLALGCFSLTACKDEVEKIGVILVGDETEGYTKAHMDGIEAAAAKLGLSDRIVYKKKVDESSACSTAAKELIAQGCTLVISNSYGHQDFMVEVAEENPNVSFVSMTGDYAAITGLKNFYNAFTQVYESRYVSGVVAGLKLAEIKDQLTEKNYAGENIKIGYVGAFPYAEVVSGYTAFFLGIQSIVPNVVMEVKYTDSWFDFDKEAAAAEYLMSTGCCIIGQHADSAGAPSAVEAANKNGTLCYSVGYNVSMLGDAPTVALTSASNTWAAYYTELLTAWKNGTAIPQDWSKGYSDGAVNLTELGKACAAGTADKVAAIEAAIKNGTLHVFDTSKFTVGGAQLTTYTVDLSYYDWANGGVCVYEGAKVNPIKTDANGVSYFDESAFRSAPYFDVRIDGITETAATEN